MTKFMNEVGCTSKLQTCTLRAVPASTKYKSTQSTLTRVMRYLMSSPVRHGVARKGSTLQSGC